MGYVFDVGVLALLIGGGAWGYANGDVKTGFKLVFIMAPSLTMAYFGADVSHIGQVIAGMLGDRVSAPLGIVGAGAGLLGMVGIIGSFILGSRIFLAILDFHQPAKTDRYVGAAMGIVGFIAMALPVFIFAAKAFPTQIAQLTQSALSWSYLRPAIVRVHRPIDGFIEARMAGLVNGLSDNQFIARLALQNDEAQGSMPSGLVEKASEIDFKEVLRLQKAARA
jgi:hypothetical protein